MFVADAVWVLTHALRPLRGWIRHAHTRLPVYNIYTANPALMLAGSSPPYSLFIKARKGIRRALLVPWCMNNASMLHYC